MKSRLIALAMFGLAVVLGFLVPFDGAHAATLPDGWVQVTDETGTITVGIPQSWTQFSTAPSTTTGEPAAQIVASPDLARFYEAFDVSGVTYQTMPYTDMPVDETIEMMGGMMGNRACPAPVIEPYDDGTLVGTRAAYVGCNGASNEYHILVASPPDQSFTAFVAVAVVAPDPVGTADLVFGTLALTPGPASSSTATVPTLAPDPTLPAFPAPSGVAPAGWVPLVDDTHTFEIAVPPSWGYTDTAPFGTSPAIDAAPTFEAWEAGTGPFVAVGTSAFTEHTDALATLAFYAGWCADNVTHTFDNGAIAGHITTYSNCTQPGLTVYRVLGNSPTNTTYSLGLTIAVAGGPDDAALLDGLLSTARFVA